MPNLVQPAALASAFTLPVLVGQATTIVTTPIAANATVEACFSPDANAENFNLFCRWPKLAETCARRAVLVDGSKQVDVAGEADLNVGADSRRAKRSMKA